MQVSATVDPVNALNAVAFAFLQDGIPIIVSLHVTYTFLIGAHEEQYYGQEQGFSAGYSDPYNRQAMWLYDRSTDSQQYAQIRLLNRLRSGLIASGSPWIDSPLQFLVATKEAMAFRKGPVLAVLSNQGSPPSNKSIAVLGTGFPSMTALIEIFTCDLYTVGDQSSIFVAFTNGALPRVFIETALSVDLHICEEARSHFEYVEARVQKSHSSRADLTMHQVFATVLFVLWSVT